MLRHRAALGCANPSSTVDVDIFHKISEKFSLLVARGEDRVSPNFVGLIL